MNTCDTCKWWNALPNSNDRFCLHPKVGGLGDGKDDEAYHDYEDVYIMTGPKFGCVHHEPK